MTKLNHAPEIKNSGEIRKCPKLKPPKISTITVASLTCYNNLVEIDSS